MVNEISSETQGRIIKLDTGRKEEEGEDDGEGELLICFRKIKTAKFQKRSQEEKWKEPEKGEEDEDGRKMCGEG